MTSQTRSARISMFCTGRTGHTLPHNREGEYRPFGEWLGTGPTPPRMEWQDHPQHTLFPDRFGLGGIWSLRSRRLDRAPVVVPLHSGPHRGHTLRLAPPSARTAGFLSWQARSPVARAGRLRWAARPRHRRCVYAADLIRGGATRLPGAWARFAIASIRPTSSRPVPLSSATHPPEPPARRRRAGVGHRGLSYVSAV